MCGVDIRRSGKQAKKRAEKTGTNVDAKIECGCVVVW